MDLDPRDYDSPTSLLAAERACQDAQWAGGFTRRRFLQGLGMVGVATLGTQLVTSRMSFASADTTSDGNTLVVVFLRGAVDGLRVLAPVTADLGAADLAKARPNLVLPASAQLALSGGGAGWALNSALSPLQKYWGTGELAFVPATSIAGLRPSHFDAQALIEAGGVSSSSGWLDRALGQIDPGTAFRSVAVGGAMPASLAGDTPSMSMNTLKDLTLLGNQGRDVPTNRSALAGLYGGVGGYFAADVPEALTALTQAGQYAAIPTTSGVTYPSGDFGAALADIARLLHGEAGLQVATVDVGGWDTHTHEAQDLDPLLGTLAGSLDAFLTDLGPTRRSRVTVAVMTEFGRVVAQNASMGTDHGRGSVLWLLGGGLRASGVYGRWTGLAPAALDGGAVPYLNDAYDVLGELLTTRLGVGATTSIFPAHHVTPLGIFRS